MWGYMKNKIWMILAITAIMLFQSGSAIALSDEQQGYISQNCGSLRQSLKQLQHADSRTRVYLGSTYEVLYTDFMSPMNKRLTSLGRTAEELSRAKSEFETTRADFNDTFIRYQISLENLISIDCTREPDDFYTHLEITRNQRGDLSELTSKMKELSRSYLDNAAGLGATL